VLEAYFDESERTGGVFGVAGYAFVPAQARKFEKEWSTVFAASGGCHMVDLAAARGEFKGTPRKELDQLLKEAVKIINKRISFGVSISCNVAEVQQLSPRWIQGFGHAYPICCHFAMFALGNAIGDAGLRDDVAYTFEAGHLYEPEARAFMMNVAKGGPFKESYRYRSDSFLSKSDAIPLQAADMLAWEWTKCQDETLEKRIRPIRQSLYALFKSDPRRYTVRHFTGPKLAEYFGIARNLGLLQLQEDEQR
jgi:hypothetical protein